MGTLGQEFKLLNISRFLSQQECSYDSVKSTQVHHFSDASPGAYGVVTFLRFVYENDIVICRFTFLKARLALLNDNINSAFRTHSRSACCTN